MSVPLYLDVGHETGPRALRQRVAGLSADIICPATVGIVNCRASDYKRLARVIA